MQMRAMMPDVFLYNLVTAERFGAQPDNSWTCWCTTSSLHNVLVYNLVTAGRVGEIFKN